jgi:sugar/nucleoside kinase (ribokinase family)
MHTELGASLRKPLVRAFDVICAGEARWNVAPTTDPASLRFRPGGGAVDAALTLARQGHHVGLVTVLGDDRAGRVLLEKMSARGIDVGGVSLSPPHEGLVFIERVGGARQVVPYREDEEPIAIPDGWSSQVLLVSGLSPVVAQAGALCKAARAARRAGTVVVVDVNARWHLWAGRDARTIRMILREADVVWCSAEDLLALNMDVDALRAALRPTAVLAANDGAGTTFVTGPFGEIARAAEGELSPSGPANAFPTAICAELARAGGATGGVELWERALKRGHAAMMATAT